MALKRELRPSSRRQGSQSQKTTVKLATPTTQALRHFHRASTREPPFIHQREFVSKCSRVYQGIDMKLNDRKVLVTGGTEGIGKALVNALTSRGCHVLTCARNLPEGPVSESVSAGRTTYIGCDLTKADSVRALNEEVQARHSDLSLVIHNAAVQHQVDFTQSPLSLIESTCTEELVLNLQVPVLLTAALLPVLQRQQDAAIVNITTGLALAPKRSSPVYCATKAALRSFTRSLRYQLESGPGNVSVIEAVPPLVDTRMTTGRGSGKMAPADVAEALLSGVERGQSEIYIGKARLLKAVMRISPSIAYRVAKSW